MTCASVSRFAAGLLSGPPRRGRALGHGYVRFGDDVIAITPPGAPRMPNGIECDLDLTAGETVDIGNGELRTTTSVVVDSGTRWDARPTPRHRLTVRPQADIDLETLPGRGPGLTPLGDDILVGFLAAATFAGRDVRAEAEGAARHTTALSATLLRLAAEGELAEAAHRLLEDGDVEPLLGFGHTSGAGIALGLASAVPGEVDAWARTACLDIDGSHFELQIVEEPPC